MRLASDPITITVDGHAAVLYPTLRAAYHLERRHGLAALIKGVIDGNLSMIADLVAHGCDDDALPALIREIDNRGIVRLDLLKPSLIAFLMALVGFDGEEPADAKPSGKPVDFDEHYTGLFEFATGWLGWTPDTAWNATPAEIIAAQRGRVAMLKAIYGGGEDKHAGEYDPAYQPSEDEIRQGIAALKANARRGRS